MSCQDLQSNILSTIRILTAKGKWLRSKVAAARSCGNLTAEQADLVIKRLLDPQTKTHNQMHEKLGYPAGKLAEFLDAEDLLY